MIEDIRNTKYFHYLLKNFKELDEERIKFNDEIIGLLKRETDELGTVLKCHLIIEYYIDNYLKAAYPTVVNWQSSRLSFSQKLELVNNDSTPLGMYYRGIKCLNSIRNKFSHKISYTLSDTDYSEIKKMMTIWNEALGKPIPEGLQLIENFTILVCGNINAIINGIYKHTSQLGISGYISWLQEMQKNQSEL